MRGNSTTAVVNNGLTYGWTSGPDGRGTWNILSSCLLTIILCCWTSVCPNIPATTDSYWNRFRDKLHLACMGLLGPEFLLMVALEQWASARGSVKKFHGAGYTDWTLTHAFFADMGGFLLHAPGYPDFPLDAEQLYYLVMEKYLECPNLSKKDIEDKNKADGLSRFITICQVVWFLANCVARPIQGLYLTTLELTTVSFIIVLFAISFAWRHKPLDVSRPVILKTETHIDSIRKKSGHDPQEHWIRTPLDLISRKEWFCGMFWRYYTQILHNLHIPLFSRRVTTKPYNRIPSDNFPVLDKTAEFVGAPVILIFSGTFLLAWNFSFPSTAELIMWRTASIFTVIYGSFGMAYTYYCHKILLPRSRKQRLQVSLEAGPSSACEVQLSRTRISRLAAKLRNIDPDKDPHLEIPLPVFIPVTILCALYCLCRAYTLIEDFIGLRSLPPSAFETVSWSKYVPHL